MVVRKGRENYLCLLNLEDATATATGGFAPAGLIPFGLIARWAMATADGDIQGGDLPGWLSLSGTSGDYTGGAHPNHGPTALLWDKTANRQVKALDLFQSKAAFSASIRKPFCAALNVPLPLPTNIETSLDVRLPTARSRRPSPFRSVITISAGPRWAP